MTRGAVQYGLAGKVALITGGSKNIGRAIATSMASVGAVAAVAYNNDEQGTKQVCE